MRTVVQADTEDLPRPRSGGVAVRGRESRTWSQIGGVRPGPKLRPSVVDILDIGPERPGTRIRHVENLVAADDLGPRLDYSDSHASQSFSSGGAISVGGVEAPNYTSRRSERNAWAPSTPIFASNCRCASSQRGSLRRRVATP